MVFIQNKYTRIYYSIISNAQARTLPKETYIEKHHIIPKSLGGNNSAGNLVKLTAREHFICHWLLTKMTIGVSYQKMLYALHVMQAMTEDQQRYETKITSRVFDKMRGKRKPTKATCKRISEAKKGKKHSSDHIAKLKISASNRIVTAESNAKRSTSLKGRIISDETKRKMSDTAKMRQTKQCQYCSKSVTRAMFFRWHGNNCKLKN